MKVVLISDCHNQTPDILFNGDEDIIIHAGDMTRMGRPYEIRSFIQWFGSLPVRNKATIAGNHDFGLEDHNKEEYERAFGISVVDDFFAHKIHYLQDSSITIDGVSIYGSPWSPEFNDWAFNLKRGQVSDQFYSTIPMDSDIIVTHSPLAFCLDRTKGGDYVGCESLYNKIVSYEKKVLHVCGHIHEGYGIKCINDKVTTVNASLLDERYKLVNRPIVYHLDKQKDKIEYTDFGVLEFL